MDEIPVIYMFSPERTDKYGRTEVALYLQGCTIAHFVQREPNGRWEVHTKPDCPRVLSSALGFYHGGTDPAEMLVAALEDAYPQPKR